MVAELPCLVVRGGEDFLADQAGNCAMTGNRSARGTFGLTSTGFAGLIYSMYRKHILGEINLYRDNARDGSRVRGSSRWFSIALFARNCVLHRTRKPQIARRYGAFRHEGVWYL